MSELILEDWELDFPAREGVFTFAWTETHEIKVVVSLDCYVDSEWQYFNGRDYEVDIPCCDIDSYVAYDVEMHHNSGTVLSEEITGINEEDEKIMKDVVNDEYSKYLKEVAYDY